jgi:hypothetical protein
VTPPDPAGLLDAVGDGIVEMLARYGLLVALVTVVVAAVWLGAREWWWRRRLVRWSAHARLVEVMPPPVVDPAGGPALWGHLVGLLRPAWARAVSGQPHVAFEYTWTGPVASMRIWVPGVIPPGLIERAVQAAWPGVHTATGPAGRAPVPASVLATGGTLRLARTEALPLATGQDADPLRALFAAATGLAPREHACVQILARPAAGRRLRRARRALRRLRTGSPARPASVLLDLLTPGVSPARIRRPATEPDRASEVRAASAKLAEPAWEVTIRYAVAGDGRVADGNARDRLRGQAHALASAFALYSGRNFLTRRRLRRPARVLARRMLRRGDLLSVTELAAIAHLPVDADTPGLARAGARAVAPPPAVRGPLARRPAGDGSSDHSVKVLGEADSGPVRTVGVTVPDACHHLHVIGSTGSGKSTLLAQLVLSDVAAGRGVLLIDPKGDLVTDLLDRLPAGAADRLTLIDPDCPAPPACLNPLDVTSGSELDTAVDNLVGIFRRIYAAFWGPRTDDVLRAAALTLMRPRGRSDAASGVPETVVTLADVPRLLDDPDYRARLTAGISDEVLGGFWAWYDRLSDTQRAQVVGPLLNKLRAFLLRPFVYQVVAAGPATLDLDQVLDGGIALIRLPKGVIGQETSRLLGSFVVARIWQAVSARARTGAPRRDAGLYLDEAHNYLNLPYPIEDMLAEARGYRLSMTLAHQNLTQLPTSLREGISANARNKIFFAVSPEDARDLERHMTPALNVHDLSHLGAFQAAARLVTDSAETPAFTLRTRPLTPPVPGRARLLRRVAAARTFRASTSCASSGRRSGAVPGTAISTRTDPRWQFQPAVPASGDSTAPDLDVEEDEEDDTP